MRQSDQKTIEIWQAGTTPAIILRSLALVIIALQVTAAVSDDWPAFRGPVGNGSTKDTSQIPLKWTNTENVRWKMKMPKQGNGSPIVSNGRVFVTCAKDDEGKQRSLYCLDRSTGRILWQRIEKIDQKMPTHKTNMYCGTTPAADGKKVVVWHGSAGLFCYGFDGRTLWNRKLGEFKHMWGYGTSPVIHEGKVILHTGPGKETFVACYGLETGEEIWKTPEPQTTDGNRNENNQPMGSWCTPLMYKGEMKELVICGMSTRVVAYHLEDGKLAWFCKGTSHMRGDLQYSSPLLSGKLCFITGGYSGPAFAFQMRGSGDITAKARLWRSEKNPQSIGSGVLIEGFVYRPNAGPATIECLDPQTGKVQWRDRGAGANSWGSIVYAGGHCFLTSQNGATIVFKPDSEKMQRVAINRLGEHCNSTPAISDGQIFIRTFDHLYCIGE